MKPLAIVGCTAVAAVAGYAAYTYLTATPVPSKADTGDEATPLIDSQGSKRLAEVLKGNEALLNPKEQRLVAQLLQLGQGHLFAAWPAKGTSDAEKRCMVQQLVALDQSYHGGLAAYINNARQLLRDSKEGRNAFAGFTPAVPHGEKLDFASPDFLALEEAGLQEAGRAAFVLVAGGLGERLGYSGIKVALPCESATGTTFLELYARFILALQQRSGASKPLPFAIMTSGDTHDRTLALLEKNSYFGMAKEQVTLMKQEKVACLIDNDAHLALEPKNSFQVQTKPHGHGDVHALLHSTGLVKKWNSDGIKWVCFFQDTNALVFRALTAALGVSAKHDYDMNSLAVPRRAKEAIGAISQLKHEDGHSITINVEYNQLDPLLRSTISKEGDVNDSTGFSPFPGNINQLVLKVPSYAKELERTGGIISEFVNPKYKDASKNEFKSSTRLECMMQDYPKALPQGARVGFTTMNQVWASYSPVKNSPADALAKAKQNDPTHSATAGELDIYKCNALMLQTLVGASLPAKLEVADFNGITSEMYPRVVLSPNFAPVLQDVKAKIKPGSIKLAPGAVLIIDGADITIDGPVDVSGTLVIYAAPGAKVKVGPLRVRNAGWEWTPIPEAEAASAREEDRIRGFRVVRKDTREIAYGQPGTYEVSDSAGAEAGGSGAKSIDKAAGPASKQEHAAPTTKAAEAPGAPPSFAAAVAAPAADPLPDTPPGTFTKASEVPGAPPTFAAAAAAPPKAPEETASAALASFKPPAVTAAPASPTAATAHRTQ